MPAESRPASSAPARLVEPRFFLGEAAAEVGVFQTNLGEVAVATVADLEKSGPNEDSAAVVPVGEEHLVLIVSDGVGGLPVARRASNLTVQTIHAALKGSDGTAQGLRTAIMDGIEAANREVLALGTGAASTLALAEIGPDYVRTYHVGDSIILICGQRGRIKRQTISHSPVGFAMEAGLLNETEALQHAELNIISNVIGAADMSIEVGSQFPMAPRDTVVLASDGLSDNLMQEEIVRIVRKGRLEEAIHGLAVMVERRMRAEESNRPSKPDDFTAVLFRRRSKQMPRSSDGP